MASSVATPARAPQNNFSGGPGALPESVLEQAQQAIREVPSQGLSVLGISHRAPWFRDVVDEAEANILSLLGASSDYRVLFLQGGGSLQFSMIAQSFLRGTADYLDTGHWSAKSIETAKLHGQARTPWSGAASGYRRLPSDRELEFSPAADYLHYVSNETVEGLQFRRVVGNEGVPRICDMSSDFLSRPIDVSRYALIYAHAQKNLGPAGVTVAVIHSDLLARIPRGLPPILDYREHVRCGSIYNTPPVFAIYVTLLVTRWLRNDVGGVQQMAAINQAKAQRLYGAIEESQGFYAPRAASADRSLMNVTFHLPAPALDNLFIEQAESAGLYGLAGHRTVGGVRASLYNAVTAESVDSLVSFMKHFRSKA